MGSLWVAVCRGNGGRENAADISPCKPLEGAPRACYLLGKIDHGRHEMIRTALTTLALTGALFGLTACETTKGAGRDISKAGQAISGAAQDVQNNL
ncbi:entericidin A/B family lipoprotein [Phaeobacter inhibens]|uniref:entericidin A/B family lipoprotein n=1 Tax=Phaeobacter inhibens TaxID=221822 RepID=UPI000CA0FCAE|nr:putative small secreted protein [Phaeobacter inhibens]AUQ78991.1 putative small secreted protein [Phaeobacter inhibens]AUR16150.1 putative small secreted protein [Phaeobacter inhibens]